MKNAVYDVVVRLRSVLDVLSAGTWVRQDEVMNLVGYGADLDAAKPMVRRDVNALRHLGFNIQKQGGHPPRYRLLGYQIRREEASADD